MKTKLLLAATVAAISLGAAGAQAAPALVQTNVATESTGPAIEQAHHWRRHYYYGYYNYYYYKPYYYNCYWSYGYKYCY